MSQLKAKGIKGVEIKRILGDKFVLSFQDGDLLKHLKKKELRGIESMAMQVCAVELEYGKKVNVG